jgi:hypothetical protein
MTHDDREVYIQDIYARISMPALPSGRVPQAFICHAIYVVFSEHRWDPKGGVSNYRLQNGWSWEVHIWWAGGGDLLQHGVPRIGPKLFGGCV